MSVTIGRSWVMKAAIISIIASYIGYYIFLCWGFSDGGGALEGVRSGSFGDAFGTLNALFSGLAFSGVLVTIFLQRKDLAGSQEQISRQQVESQFYNMLGLQQNVVQGFDLHRRRSKTRFVIQGRDCFRTWCRELQNAYSDNFISYRSSADVDRIIASYLSVMKQHQGDLGLYFRSLYSVYRFIEGTAHADKSHFSIVVRSLLSDYELVILYYNCLTVSGKNFKKYAINYMIFDNLDVGLLLKEEHVVLMEREAFGGNERALDILDKFKSKSQIYGGRIS